MTTVVPQAVPPPMIDTSDHSELHDSLHESRRSVAKEQWRNLLEVFAELDAEKQAAAASTTQGEQEGADGQTTPYSDVLVSNNNQTPAAVGGGDVDGGVVMDRRLSLAGTVANTIVTEANTVAQLNELNEDLENTADNLADLEIEFAEDLQTLSMGLESAFEQWNASEADMMTAVSLQFLQQQGGQMPLTDESIRSEFGTSIRSEVGTSIRSVRQHARHLEHIKRDMENTFRQTVKKQECRRRSIARGVDPNNGDFTVEEEEEVEAKFQNWFSRVWTAIEGFMVRRRQQRQQAKAIQQARRESLASSSKVKSFWRLFMEP